MRLITNSIPLGANVHKNLLPVVRILIALSAVSYIIFILTGISEKEWIIWKTALDITPSRLLALGLAFLLMPVNWAFEVAKWKLLSEKLQPQSWNKVMQAVLYGISLGMITPKRTGEFAGRVYWLQPGNRFSGLLLNTAGSLSQLFITIFAGVTAVFIMLPQMQSHYKLVAPEMASPSWFLRAGITGGIVILACLVFLLKISRAKNLRRNTLRSKIQNRLNVFTLLSAKDFSRLTGLSFLRYCTFSFQFYLLITLFGLQIPFFTAFSLIAIIYLFMTLIPLSAIWELGVRGSVAVLVFGLYFTPAQSQTFEMPVLAATSLLWAINLGIPALTGGFLGLNSELNKTKNKE
ncbi:MAG: lysylphosphatidylglycerol synthase domain-containing protein [bacterium]